MSDRLLVGTRKGLFTYRKNSSGEFNVADRPAFFGAPVSMLLHDHRTQRTYVALNHGHFGAKMHVSTDDGSAWQELTAPAFDKDEPGRIPKQDGTTTEQPPSVMQIWSLESGGEDQPGVLWAGTIPGGLFRSEDDGRSWKLVRSLWDRTERMQWMGGGADWPGIHSIRRSARQRANIGGYFLRRDVVNVRPRSDVGMPRHGDASGLHATAAGV